MRIILSLLVLTLSTASHAAGVKFKTINQARAAGNFNAFCYTRSGVPQLSVNYFNDVHSFDGPKGTLVLMKAQEGLYVRDFISTPTTIGIPPINWSLSPMLGDMTITGRFYTPFNEQIDILVEDDNDGTFDGAVSYKNFTTGLVVERDVRCLLTSAAWKP